MRTLYHWQYYCISEGVMKSEWRETAPTACLSSPNHSIRNVISVDVATETANFDQFGRIRMVDTSKHDPYQWSYFSSCGDTANEVGAGTPLVLSLTSEASKAVEIEFLNSYFELHYGIFTYMNARAGDMATFTMASNATPVEAVTGGNFILYPAGIPSIDGTGSASLILPSPGGPGTGTHNITGDIVPVFAYAPADWAPCGQWDKTGEGYTLSDFTFNPLGKGAYYLLDKAISLGKTPKRMAFVGVCGHFDVANEDACFTHKGYKFIFEMINSRTNRNDDTALEGAVVLKMNRRVLG